MIRVTANGRALQVDDDSSVADLIRSRDLDPRFVVVELNGEPLERSRYEEVTLSDGDRLELVRAVAGGADLRARLEASRLYVVADARREQGDLEVFLDAILGAGVDIVQLREKEAEAGDLLRWAETFRAAADRHGALFTINDRPDVAIAAGADGVHVGQNDLPVGVARRVVGDDLIVGLSTHAAGEWDAAPSEADYLTAGPVWETPTKPGRPAAGLEHVAHAAGHADRPWFAIGGITPENLPQVVEAGATRIVVVRAVTEADDPAAGVERLLRLLP
ncbi:MAG TPA: thiamine phosphate synthase [Actinomycetota bacterium]